MHLINHNWLWQTSCQSSSLPVCMSDNSPLTIKGPPFSWVQRKLVKERPEMADILMLLFSNTVGSTVFSFFSLFYKQIPLRQARPHTHAHLSTPHDSPSPAILTINTLFCHYVHSNRLVMVILCLWESVILHVLVKEGVADPLLSDFLTPLSAAPCTTWSRHYYHYMRVSLFRAHTLLWLSSVM